MKQLSNVHRDLIVNYLKAEPEFNLFMLGDVENYGLEDPHVSVYTDDRWSGGKFPYLLLRYMGKYLIYTQSDSYDTASVSGFLLAQNTGDVSGKAEIVEKLIPFMPDMEKKRTLLSRLEQINALPEYPLSVLRLTEEHVREIYEFYYNVEELPSYRAMKREEALEAIRQNLGVSGRTYGLFTEEQGNRRLVSAASTSAETTRCAMIIGVATLAPYRRKGFAQAVVGRLCRDCLREGIKYLCLFYDNPEAGRIYQKIGFREMGYYTMLLAPQT